METQRKVKLQTELGEVLMKTGHRDLDRRIINQRKVPLYYQCKGRLML